MLSLMFPLVGCFLCSSPGNSTDPMIANLIHDTEIKQIRYKNWMWNCFVNSDVLVEVGDTLFVDQKLWEATIREKREVWLAGLIAHESTHAARQINMGLVGWIILYGTNTKFRLDEEKIASIEGWRVYIKREEAIFDYDMRGWAREMSSSTYGNIITYEEALLFVRETIVKLLKNHDATILTNN